MKKIKVITSFIRGSGYAIALQKVINKTLKVMGIGAELEPKKRSEKISEFNKNMLEVFENNNIPKYYVVKIVPLIEGDEKDFTITNHMAFIFKPHAIMKGSTIRTVGADISEEEFEKIYEETIHEVMNQEELQEALKNSKKKKKERNEESGRQEVKEMSLMDFLNNNEGEE